MPIHGDIPSTSSRIPALQTPAVSSFLTEEASFPVSSVNPGASDGELGCISHPSSSSEPRAGHSLVIENLMWQQEKAKTPRKRKL
jgi:hypothetical protein